MLWILDRKNVACNSYSGTSETRSKDSLPSLVSQHEVDNEKARQEEEWRSELFRVNYCLHCTVVARLFLIELDSLTHRCTEPTRVIVTARMTDYGDTLLT